MSQGPEFGPPGAAAPGGPRLVIDPRLLVTWQGLLLAGAGPPELIGLAGELSSDGLAAAAIVVTDRPLAEPVAAELAARLAEALGAPTALVTLSEPVPLSDVDVALPRLLRQWVNQAAHGAGRGVRLALDLPPEPAPIRLALTSIDSSARELAMRLASPTEPALAALQTLLNGRHVIVVDSETHP